MRTGETDEPNDEQSSPGLMLSPATRLLWRAPDCVHLELGGEAVLVEGLAVPTVRRFAAPRNAMPSATYDPPLEPAEREALAALAAAGYLWPRDPADATARPEAKPASPRLAGELAALAARHGPAAADILTRRSGASVVVNGSGRLVAQLGALLAAAGVGQVCCNIDGTTLLRHAVPGGVSPDDEGRSLRLATDRALHRAAPEVNTAPPAPHDRPDLTIVVAEAPISDDRRHALHAVSAAHLAVGLGIDSGIVGPLVLPGLTSCLHCADLHRLDRDPAWTALAVQLSVPGRYGAASEVAVATVVAGVAALQALTFLDGGDPGVIDATIELHMPDWRLRRRSWPPHPDCDCGEIAEMARTSPFAGPGGTADPPMRPLGSAQ